MKPKLYPTKGDLKYYDDGWVVLKLNPDILRYYQYMLKKSIGSVFNKPKFGAHVTVVAGKYENCVKHEAWKKYNGSEVYVEYSPDMKEIDGVFWLVVYSPWLSEIRQELGLGDLPKWPFHLTIANRKNL